MRAILTSPTVIIAAIGALLCGAFFAGAIVTHRNFEKRKTADIMERLDQRQPVEMQVPLKDGTTLHVTMKIK